MDLSKMMQLEGNVVQNKESQILKMDKTYCSVNLNDLKLQILTCKVRIYSRGMRIRWDNKYKITECSKNQCTIILNPFSSPSHTPIMQTLLHFMLSHSSLKLYCFIIVFSFWFSEFIIFFVLYLVIQ